MATQTVTTADLLTAAQVAEILNINIHTVYRLIRSRRLPAVQLSQRSYRVRAADLDAYIESRMTMPPGALEAPQTTVAVSSTTLGQRIASTGSHEAQTGDAQTVTTPKTGETA